MRLALFGGTFDPIHRGHLAIAKAAATAFALDTVLFCPTGRQPLKNGPTATFEERLTMTRLACAAMASPTPFEASDLDAPHPDGSPNYTLEALTALWERHPDASFYNLVGLDSFLDLPRWREPHRLLELAEWIVVSRPGYNEQLAAAFAQYTPAQQARIHPLHTVHEDVSATALRARLAQGDPCPDLIPAPVADYIAHYGLYLHG